MAIASTPCSPLPATTSALGYNEDRRQLQLMDGWQASEAWRANLRAEYILSEAGSRGRRRCGVGREEDSDQRCQDRCPAIFISKIFSQKIWPKNWGGSSNGGFRERHVCGSGSAPPRPLSCRKKGTSRGSDPGDLRRGGGGLFSIGGTPTHLGHALFRALRDTQRSIDANGLRLLLLSDHFSLGVASGVSGRAGNGL